MNPERKLPTSRPLASLVLLGVGLAFFAGCQSKTAEKTVQKTESAPKSKTQAPETIEPSAKTEESKTPESKPIVKREPELPPEPPSSEELAIEEVKKRGGKAELNRNGNVAQVTLTGPEISDNDLVILQAFPFLSKLDLTETSITDAGLKHLEPLDGLRYLYLLGTSITDAGVPQLQKHTRLKALCLDDTQVTNSGVKLLEPLSGLVMLHLATQGDITDACIGSLIKLPELQEIKLEGTKVSEAGKARLLKAKPDIEFIGGNEEGIPLE